MKARPYFFHTMTFSTKVARDRSFRYPQRMLHWVIHPFKSTTNVAQCIHWHPRRRFHHAVWWVVGDNVLGRKEKRTGARETKLRIIRGSHRKKAVLEFPLAFSWRRPTRENGETKSGKRETTIIIIRKRASQTRSCLARFPSVFS
jgi:hypothetical protein